MTPSEIVHSPLVDCILGAALLVLLAFLGWFIQLWRKDLRSDRKASQDIAVSNAQVVERNTAAFDSLGKKIEQDSTLTQELLRRMEGRPCLSEEEERYRTLQAASDARRRSDGD